MRLTSALLLVLLTACTSSVKEDRFYIDEMKKTLLNSSVVKDFNSSSGDQAKAIDLKEFAEKECTMVVTRPLYMQKGKVEIYHQPKLDKQATEIAETVAKISQDCVIKISEKTKVKDREFDGVIYLLTNGTIRFYLMQFDTIPADYKYSCTHILDDTIFEAPLLITKADDLWNPKHNPSLIDTIFWTMPHELSHDYFRGEGNVRWFECGFGEYMAYTISAKHNKLDATLTTDAISPKEALAKTGKKIFEWNDEDDSTWHSASLCLFLTLKEKYGHDTIFKIAEKIHSMKKFAADDVFDTIKASTGADLRDYVK